MINYNTNCDCCENGLDEGDLVFCNKCFEHSDDVNILAISENTNITPLELKYLAYYLLIELYKSDPDLYRVKLDESKRKYSPEKLLV